MAHEFSLYHTLISGEWQAMKVDLPENTSW